MSALFFKSYTIVETTNHEIPFVRNYCMFVCIIRVLNYYNWIEMEISTRNKKIIWKIKFWGIFMSRWWHKECFGALLFCEKNEMVLIPSLSGFYTPSVSFFQSYPPSMWQCSRKILLKKNKWNSPTTFGQKTNKPESNIRKSYCGF